MSCTQLAEQGDYQSIQQRHMKELQQQQLRHKEQQQQLQLWQQQETLSSQQEPVSPSPPLLMAVAAPSGELLQLGINSIAVPVARRPPSGSFS